MRRLIIAIVALGWIALIVWYQVRGPICFLSGWNTPFPAEYFQSFRGLPLSLLQAFLFPSAFMIGTGWILPAIAGRWMRRHGIALGGVEQWLLSCALGSVLIACVTLLLGWPLGLLKRPVFYALYATLLIPGLIYGVRSRVGARKWTAMKQWWSESNIYEKFAAGFLCVLGLLLVLYAATPPVQSDGLRYHLAAPQEWIKRGAITHLPLNAFSNLPFTGELLFLFCMIGLGDIAAKLTHALAFAGTLVALWLFWKRLLARKDDPQPVMGAQWLPVLIVAATPVSYLVAGWEFIDHFSALYYTLAFYAMGHVLRKSEIRNPKSETNSKFEIPMSETGKNGGDATAPENGKVATALEYGGFAAAWEKDRVAAASADSAHTCGTAAPGCAERRFWLVLCGIFCGAAAGTKLTMLPMVALIGVTLALAPLLQRDTERGPAKRFTRGLRGALLVALIAFALFAPWMLKSYQFTGNPLYPAANSIFKSPEWSAGSQRLYMQKAHVKGTHRFIDNQQNDLSVLSISQRLPSALVKGLLFLRSPLDSAFYFYKGDYGAEIYSMKNGGKAALTLRHGNSPDQKAIDMWNIWGGYEDHFQGLIYLAFLPAWLVLFVISFWGALKQQNENRSQCIIVVTLGLTALAYWTFWFFSYQSNRFLIPLFPVLALLIGASIQQISRWWKAAGIGCAALLVILAALQVWWSVHYIACRQHQAPLSVALGFQSRDQYLSQHNYYPMTRLLSNMVKPDERVLFIGEFRGYYFDRVDYFASDWFDTPAILWLIRQTKSNDELIQQLWDENFRYIYFNLRELSLYPFDFFRHFNDQEKNRFTEFMASEALAPVWPAGAQAPITMQSPPEHYLLRLRSPQQ